MREKGDMSVTDLAETAEKYRLAHLSESMSAKQKTDVWSCSAVPEKTFDKKTAPFNKQPWNRGSQTFPRQTFQKRFQRGCFN